ncbi:histone-lysine N-methyltransferase SETDB2-like [Empidonax traillii]|uniref:histone-lysine N-methyltransferase SETDB2-like n=1 Tax=Empidonax traillii TaxID=164674 RepID=UPI000FFD8FB8|nr:histone-lysine N-methyltransferase SETDB2-like [Empidonax traillii]
MEEERMLHDFFEEENLTSSREESIKGDLKTFWTRLGGSRVDVIFEQVQNVLLLLKEKIKNGTATNQECWQAWALVNEANLSDLLTLTNVSDGFDGDGQQETKPKLQRLLADGNTTKAVEGSDRNPLRIPILFHFQRRHAKADCLSKSLDVNYKAPCGRSLRSFRDVQNYLFETKCNFLFVDHFSFNTYVLLGRNTMNPKPLVFDFDISNGAESVPISFCNNLDHARLPYFKYRKSSWPRGYYLNNFSSLFVDSCDCTDGCIDKSKCACLQLTARGCSKTSLSSGSKRSHGYRYKRLEGPVPSGIYECSVLCRCDKLMCQNRVVQHGIQVRLQVFNTEKKGWGVRCLDDIDKGTFVCTYSGRLMSRAEVLGDAGQELKEKGAVNDRNHGFFSKKRKLDTDCSNSVIELVQTGKHDILENQESLSQTVDSENKSTLVHPKNSSIATARPGKAGFFHNNQLKMVHSASSDEDNSSQIHQSSKTKVNSGTKKGKEKSTQEQKEEHPMEIGQTESVGVDSEGCKRKSLSLQGADCGKSGVLDDTCVARPSNNNPLKADCKEENSRQSSQDAFCEEADGDGILPKNAGEENIYVLDATKEGNVGRFLNHSCCPNLFAQSVFVETHNRSFPWVAFFTNRHVKAGTELTWDYGYEAGTMPETEISCQCGVQKCRKKIAPPRGPQPISARKEGCAGRSIGGRHRACSGPSGAWPLPRGNARGGGGGGGSGGARYPGRERAVSATEGTRGEGRGERMGLEASWSPPRHLRPPSANEWAVPGLAQRRDGRAVFPALGAFWIMAKMVRRTCAFCSEGAAGSVMYIAKERDIAAHQDCLLFSSGFVESEEYNPENLDIRFDVASVLKELKRGKRLVCNFCRKKGATVGCEERACRRSYHYFCALCDDAAIETDQVKGVYRLSVFQFMFNEKRGKYLLKLVSITLFTYLLTLFLFSLKLNLNFRVFCPKHDPSNRTSHYGAANKKRRYTLTSPAITEEMKTEEKAEENHLQILKRKNNRHKVQIDLVRKCKQAGLLDDIFEEMLDTLHLAQEKLMDDNTSETEYEETVMALFDCGLFENILTNIHSGTEEKIQELLENRKRLDHKIELLQDLKEVLPTPESTASTSSTVSE